MPSKILKIILGIVIIGGAYALIKRFPDQMVLILGIVLILIVGSWMAQADRAKD